MSPVWKAVLFFWIAYIPFVCSSHYDTLGVKRNANDKEIKKAYRTLALKWHPDKAPEKERDAATKEFQKISEAYEVLSDKEQRKMYDLMDSGSDANQDSNQHTSHQRPQSQPYSGSTSQTGNWGKGRPQQEQYTFNHRNPEDVFKDFFGTNNPFDKMFMNVDTESMNGGGSSDLHGMMGDLRNMMGGMSGNMGGMGGMPDLSKMGGMGGMPNMKTNRGSKSASERKGGKTSSKPSTKSRTKSRTKSDTSSSSKRKKTKSTDSPQRTFKKDSKSKTDKQKSTKPKARTTSSSSRSKTTKKTR